MRPPWNLDIARGKPRAGGRAMAQAGCGAGAGGGARCMAVCRRSRPRGLSGWWPREEWVHRAPRREAGRTRGPGKVRSPSCPPSSGPGRAAGPPWTVAWPHPHPGSLPLYSAPDSSPRAPKPHPVTAPASTSLTPDTHLIHSPADLTR